jgi:type IX secretion system PorP/SprF family membrane protein
MKTLKKIISFVTFIIINISFIYAQDIHFSNFYNAPLILNPANTGNYIGNWRLIGNYRKQGNSTSDDYKTTTIAFDMPIYYYRQMGSIGVIFINDNSASNTLSVNKVFLSIAQFIKISSKSYLHMGFQFGYVNKKYSLSNLSYPDQFDMTKGYFNPDMPTQEIGEKQSIGYLDLNWGLIWSRKSGKFNSEIGVAMFHYNTPAESFTSFDNQLPARYLSHAYFEINFQNKLYLKPKLLYTYQNKVSELLLGSDLGLRFNNTSPIKDINLGIFYRGGFNKNLDDVIAKAGFHYQSFNFEISYDFEIPNQTISAFTKNAVELSLQYTRPSTSLKNKTIPCETF